MIPEMQQSATAKPHPSQPGTLGQQLIAIIFALHLGDARGTPAAEQWQEARQRCIPHAGKVAR